MTETKNFAGQSHVLSPPLTTGTWSFGPLNEPFLTNSLVLSPSGKIEGYSHPNEYSWRIENHHVLILSEDGNIMWRSVEEFQNEDNLLTIMFEHPGDANTKFILVQNPSNSNSIPSSANQEPIDKPAPTGLSDAEFLFPSDLEITSVKIDKVLLVGSCLTSLYHEQLQARHPETQFDYIPYNFVSVLPPTPPSPLEEYSFQYLQIPLRSILSDRIVWGGRFSEPGFTDTILQDAYNTLDAMLSATMAYNKQHGLLTFVSNFITPQMSSASSMHSRGDNNDLSIIVQKLNIYLNEKILDCNNAYVLSVDAVASTIGKRYVLDDIIYFYSHGAVIYQDWDDFGSIPRNEPIPPIETVYPIKKDAFIDSIFRQLITAYRTVKQIDQVKAVIFDLDNTLWRGQIAEHYRPESQPWPRTDGWPLGIWEAIHYLRARGILVAICSKNDYEYVKSRWDDVVEPHFLSLNDFASVKINWLPKAQNITEICKEFNIKPKNVVFVDDNPIERAAVTSAFPEIRAIGGNPYLTRRILLWSAETQIACLTKESERREKMIRGQIKREEKRVSMDRSGFLASLNCKITFTPITSAHQLEFGRVLELTNKTNQFNTTGKRWSFEEVADFLKNGGQLLSFQVKDKFTDYGLVGLLYIKDSEIIQYIMSCRVLGMEIEEFVISEVVEMLRSKQSSNIDITAILIETPDNTPCRDVYLRAGFEELLPTKDVRNFALNGRQLPFRPSHIEKMP
ncbi:phosphatase IIIC [Acetobacter pasteurianus NBRC 3299]|nr:phosphatase [Acetobacter pasteurianus]GCD75489.1 phosphatase IIIC [Acetobacter pasteurianus NBRC 3299]